MLAAHGLAGLTGVLFIGFFAQRAWNGISNGLIYGHTGQLGWQAIAVLAAPIIRGRGLTRARGCTGRAAWSPCRTLGTFQTTFVRRSF